MPCYDDRNGLRVEYREGHDPFYKQEAERLSKRCQELTELLCSAGRAFKTKTPIPILVLQWWDEHAKIDRDHGEPWE